VLGGRLPRGSWGGSSSLSDLDLRLQDSKGQQAGEPAGFAAENFEIVINLKTAKALGLDVPAFALLARCMSPFMHFSDLTARANQGTR
jgi:hypothetical protein